MMAKGLSLNQLQNELSPAWLTNLSTDKRREGEDTDVGLTQATDDKPRPPVDVGGTLRLLQPPDSKGVSHQPPDQDDDGCGVPLKPPDIGGVFPNLPNGGGVSLQPPDSGGVSLVNEGRQVRHIQCGPGPAGQGQVMPASVWFTPY